MPNAPDVAEFPESPEPPGELRNPARRRMLAQSLSLMAASAITLPSGRVCLLGDSVFDNGRYTAGGPDVGEQVDQALPRGWRVHLLAVDGATTADIPAQLKRLPVDASHLVLSVGGNDAMRQFELLDHPVNSIGEALATMSRVVEHFEDDYRNTIDACLNKGSPLTVCTVYNGNFPGLDNRRQVRIAVAAFNDAILRTAIDRKLTVIDLRQVCNRPEHFANAIEPSSSGGERIAQAIAGVLTGTAAPGARLTG
ncbi:MAG: SGNH/GDSL hydrolase family protein [Burkholderiaceae bacterium]